MRLMEPDRDAVLKLVVLEIASDRGLAITSLMREAADTARNKLTAGKITPAKLKELRAAVHSEAEREVNYHIALRAVSASSGREVDVDVETWV